ncbi:dynein regulatory complex subunit 3-like [Cloeon dipterum]|uniref:dynein regulatory complex subunit 3-like n=1 Tax=Cloeon dipterum TaxID=197152 RepID=UPI00321FD268
MSTVRVIEEQVPCVIDQLLIEKQATQKNVNARSLQALDLHSSKIFIIENLWQLESLTVLKLNDNCIEKIENLDALVNLHDLNLSFNKISKIDNLHMLVKLERLMLHSNRIGVLENMDKLQNLQLLTVSKNCIESIENIIYLRKLKNLRVLSLDGNPICSEENFMEHILVFLPNLRYYEYNLILKRDIQKSPKIKQILAKVEEEEAELEEKLKLEKENLSKKRVLEKAFVDTIEPNTLLEPLESAGWKIILKIGAAALITLQNEHKEQVQKVCEELQNIAELQMGKREEEIQHFITCADSARLKNQQEGRRIVEEYLQPKEESCEHLRRLLALAERKKMAEESPEMDQVRNLANQLITDSEELKAELLTMEIELQEQISAAIDEFSSNMEDLISAFRHEAKQKLLQLRELEQHFHQSLIEPCSARAANMYLLKWKDTHNCPVASNDLIELAKDPTLLMEKLIENHEVRLQIIWREEIKLGNCCQTWLEKLIEEKRKSEFKRGRERAMEIVQFVDLQQQEMMDLQPGSSLPSLGLL